MAYGKNGGNQRVFGFKDGQPVFKKGRTSPRRGGADEGSRGGYRSEGRGAYRNTDRREEGGARRGRELSRAFEEDERRPRVKPGERRYAPRERSYNSPNGAKMEELPRDMPPRRRREGRPSAAGFERMGRYEEPAVQTEQNPEELPNIIMGRNPVKEAIKSGRSIDRILVTKEHDGSLNEILDLARDAKLVVRDVERAKLDEICMPFGHNGRTGNHQGIVAYIPGVEYCELDDILERAAQKGEPPFVVLLDGIEDPQNLGSIIRSAECAGAHGVVITKRRSASVTAAVVKTSAGATEHLPIAKVVNLSAAIERLKEAGVWVAGADMQGEPLYKADLKGPFALVIGAEGAGVSRLVAEKCDYLVSIPLKGELESLNASVAAAVIMFEKVRQDTI